MDMLKIEISGDGTEQVKGERTQNETDLPPDLCRYKDEGCEYAGSCLECPYPRCLYDVPKGRQKWMKGLRDREIQRLFNGGRDISELARMFGLSERTVQRVLKKG